ncbi:MAG: hypothetical protein FJ333_05335 [Sphingomonadales bacterium]|nr:hypothetical protein [Sphingomonadales bacterium]
MHRLEEFIETYFHKDGQLYVKRKFKEVLLAWSELSGSEKEQQIFLRCVYWTDHEIETLLDECTRKQDIIKAVLAVDYFANLDNLKKAGDSTAVEGYIERSRVNSELRRLCKVLAKAYEVRAKHKAKRFKNVFE